VTAWGRSIFTIFLVFGICHISLVSRYPSIRGELGLTLGEMSTYIASLTIGSAAGLVIAGPLRRMLGSRRVVRIGLPLAAVAQVGAVAVLYSPMPQLALVLFPLYGVSSTAADVAFTVSGAEVERAEKRPRMSLYYGAFSIGALIALAISIAAETFSISPVPHLLVTGTLLFLVGIVAPRYIPPGGGEAMSARSAEPTDRAARPITVKVIALGLIAFGAAIAEAAANNWVPLALIDELDASSRLSVIALTVVTIGATGSRLAGDAFVSRYGRVAAIRSTLLIAAAGIATVIAAPNLTVAMVGVALWGIGVGIAGPVLISAAADDPVHAARRASTVSIINYAGFLVAPGAFGFLGDAIGLRLAFIPIAVMLVLGAIFAGIAHERSPE
jgi:MFS family permease